jgi:Icc-related predicted phosphoesterase
MGKLIIDLLSDTHNQHEKFECEGGDVLLHAGDFTGRGSVTEVIQFLDWYAKQKYTHKVLIAGNHDWAMESQSNLMADECRKRGIHLLDDSGVILKDMVEEYQIKVWGSPVQPWFHDWAFNRARNLNEAQFRRIKEIKPHWDMIPKDTEILITHGPPYEILDEVKNVMGDSYRLPQYAGCEELAKKILQTEVKLHVFGHIHEGRGIKYSGPVTYVNASCLDRMYYPASKRPIRATREIVQDGSVVYLAEE